MAGLLWMLGYMARDRPTAGAGNDALPFSRLGREANEGMHCDRAALVPERQPR